MGFTAKEARQLAESAFIGGAVLLKNNDLDAAAWRQAVSSKGGVTERAIQYFNDAGLPDIVAGAVETAKNRTAEMGGERFETVQNTDYLLPTMFPILEKNLAKVKKAGRSLSLLPEKKINQILADISRILIAKQKFIVTENQKDLKKMAANDPKYDRLLLTKERLVDIAKDINKIIALPSPLHKILEKRTRPNGLHISKITVPLGVVGIIYEARPNVTVDVFTICLKSGNACVLKGGSESYHSNIALVKLIQSVLKKHNVDQNIIYLLPNDRALLQEVMHARDFIDVIIPRGGQNLINFVRENSKVPVIETGAGIVHTFFDETGDLEIGKKIILNAKTRRVSVCNALDTLIIHKKRLKDLASLVKPLLQFEVAIFADSAARLALQGKYKSNLLHKAGVKDFGQEFLSYKMAIKTVSGLQDALEHIATHGSKHSEAIISKNLKNIETFLEQVDAACVYANTSTAFSDGGQFGMGAEIGISTQKLHARGPMALPELTTYKWVVRGKGQVRK